MAATTKIDSRQFVALSHDLKGPLSGMSQAIQVLRPTLSEAQTDAFALLESSYLQMHRMTYNILDHAQASAMGLHFDLQEIDLIPWVKETCKEWERRASWHDLTFQLLCLCKDAVLLCDPVKLERCLHNLFENAIKYTRTHGTITLLVEQVGDEVALHTIDSGEGMEPALVERILSSLGTHKQMRELPMLNEVYGLSLVQAFAKGMQGRMELASTLGEGTQVSLWFRKVR